jgi:hypothetical protein
VNVDVAVISLRETAPATCHAIDRTAPTTSYAIDSPLIIQASDNEDKENAVRVSTVDNFQGEEARIIIASLVRSNTAGRIGFLYEPQRVNVLLSRARDALVLVGNVHCLCGHKAVSSTEAAIQLHVRNTWGPTQRFTTKVLQYQNSTHVSHNNAWAKVLKHVKAVPGFPARCQQHGTEVLLRTPEDFESNTPDGGCMQPCNAQLPCDHACASRCHSQQWRHAMCREMVQCMCVGLMSVWGALSSCIRHC